ncbi:MAG: sigma-70 family RNA polymerase sigma factor [Saccharospirillaceae bacterium]|nr:sigma-70 family RNA polymerase sigma factor [Pseudomonadales bacterium]NRB81495.1 sigma-70 family RNA polymerase sigma factor [Saccharospirillaceae bacterium]
MITKDKQLMGYLLGRCALKDQKAFEQLYKLTSPKLYGLLFKMLKNEADSCEVLQSVFEKIWKNSNTLTNEIEYPWAWLCQITRNTAIDYIRCQTRFNTHIQQQTTNATDIKDDKNYFAYEPKLDDCMTQLNSQQQVAITHIYHFGYSQSEIAKLLDAPLGSVKSWIKRGLQALKLCMS